jgi:hypothetical protein
MPPVPVAELSLYTRAGVSNKRFIPSGAAMNLQQDRYPLAVLGNVLVKRQRKLDALQDQ